MPAGEPAMLRPRSGASAESASSPRGWRVLAPVPLLSRQLVTRFNPTERVVRDTGGLPEILGRIGDLEVRLARTTKDIRRCQRLRFKVFYNEMGARADARGFISRRDIDPYDRLCDHVMVIDRKGKINRFGKAKPKVIGTYRLLRSDVAAAHGVDFYTAGEYDLTRFLDANRGLRLLELGRSCVLEPYRGKRTVELLWHGVWSYILHHRIDVMFGCASFEGVEPEKLALPLAFLEHHAAGNRDARVRALPGLHVRMDRLPQEAVDLRAAMKTLPPLIKGYLRLGATFGDGAVVDHQFGTTDVFVTLRVADIDPRYIEHYGADASRYAA
ncbi:MAG: ornithine--acyl-ACP N-acyltransferase OlsB [Methylobacterium sp.]|nr:MAG: ornithine--acyl-ACP N-acyltransferase OlsB [Methylobacterium sp.]